MTCNDVEQRDIAESYLLGTLDESEREAFERHYFECARCYSELEALRAVKDVLARHPRRAMPVHRQWLALAAALFLIVATAVVWQVLRSRERAGAAPSSVASAPAEPSQPRLDAEIAQLAQVPPPPYTPLRLRGGPERRAFTTGMERYTARDFAAAIAPLQRAVHEEPAAQDARFYLGASYLMTGYSNLAIATLTPLTQDPASTYAEEAQFLVAKACLQARDLPAAVAALDKTIAFHGDREREALDLRRRVAAVSAR